MTERPMDDVIDAGEPVIEDIAVGEGAAASNAAAAVAEPARPVAPTLRRPHPIRALRRLFGGLSAVGGAVTGSGIAPGLWKRASTRWKSSTVRCSTRR